MIKKIIFSIIMILITISTIALAFDSNIEVDPNKEGAVPPELETMSTEILGALKWIGYAIALGMIIYIGIKYVMSAANEKANLKQAAINYVIGAIIVAGCTTILSFTVEAFNEAKNSVVETSESDNAQEEPHKHSMKPVYTEGTPWPIRWECEECGYRSFTTGH